MAIYDFGVTTADIAAQVQGMVITASTSPSATAVEAMIEESAAIVNQECINNGINIDPVTTDPSYAILRRMVIYKTLSDLLVGRESGNPDAGAYYERQYDKMLKTLRSRPQSIQTTNNGPDLATFTGGSIEGIDALQFNLGFTGRLARGGL